MNTRKSSQETLSRREYRKTVSNLGKAIDALTDIAESMRSTTAALSEQSATQGKKQKLIPILSMIVAIVSLLVSGYSIHQSREQWEQSGTMLQYALTAPHKNTAKEIFSAGKKTTVRTTKSSQQEILLTNTGRLSTTVVSVEATDRTGKSYKSTCSNQEVTIAPGESKLLMATFRGESIVIIRLRATLASGEGLDAEPLNTDDASLAEAFDFAARHSSESMPVCRVMGK